MMRRHWFWLLGLIAAGLLAILFAPESRLACHEPYVEETSPDGRWTITVCRRPMWIAMPGSSSDAPGWIVLRDSHRAIRGVVDLVMLQLYSGASGSPIDWTEDHVAKALVFELPLREADSKPRRWLEDRIWRLRALIGVTPSDSEFR